jgi:hypothetical protein
VTFPPVRGWRAAVAALPYIARVQHEDLARWIELYERAWRSAGTDAFEEWPFFPGQPLSATTGDA